MAINAGSEGLDASLWQGGEGQSQIRLCYASANPSIIKQLTDKLAENCASFSREKAEREAKLDALRRTRGDVEEVYSRGNWYLPNCV